MRTPRVLGGTRDLKYLPIFYKMIYYVVILKNVLVLVPPIGWQTKLISESPLIINFSAVWKQLIEKYQIELSALAYRKIPNEKDVAKCFSELIKRIE